jgi:hypothetical protein
MSHQKIGFHSDNDPEPEDYEQWNIHDLLIELIKKIDTIMQTLTDLQAAVTAEDTVIDSATVLLTGIAAQIAALQPNQAAIDALATDVKNKTASLATAVAAGTPAA